ncbi:hypothetical protein EDC94DRAFT_698110 [Helicostylum pulchrum]|uniref:Uncharacterized protein n=1 Tax=Helicostylum pulchrum TaxID=562976 RepID=A0ABP9Y754_9FUNG|nr:hypothetical protein EDC94DRAFT_698110 [Helicostylum pulchrum]
MTPLEEKPKSLVIQDEVESTYARLSPELVEPLESVKKIGLNVLDLLLLKLVKDIPRKHQRRLSDCFSPKKIPETCMKRSLSSPATTSLNQVYKILDSHHDQMNQQDYMLCCSLAALLSDVYQLLELTVKTDVPLLQQQLSDFQLQRTTQGIMSMNEPEIISIWNEMDHLMSIVRAFVVKYPASYENEAPPPAYNSIMEDSHDLDVLLNAIDRLSNAAPRLNNQRVDLTPTQVKELAAATLGKTVERLSKGRLEDQRAFLPLKSKHELLQDLIDQIQTSASRSFDNQRVCLSKIQQRKMDISSLNSVLDRLDKGRYTNQEWISHEEILIRDLKHTTDLLVKSHNRPEYSRQRYSLSADKERNLFISGLFNKVESLKAYRLIDQDAELPKTPIHEDLNQLLDRIYSSKPRFNNQRASFS